MKKSLTKKISHASKAIVFCTSLIALANQAGAQVCSNPSGVIYALANAGGIYPVTVSNANVGTIVNSTSYGTSSSANSIGYNQSNGLFYYFQVAISGPKTFVSYNPTTNVYKTLNGTSTLATVNRGCVSFDGTGYYCLDVNSALYYYNIAANSWTLITSTFKDQSNNNVTTTFTTESSGDMAIDGYGNLWILSSNGTNYGLYEMSGPLPTASVSSVTLNRIVSPSSTTPGAGFTGMAFDPSGNIYMATSTDLYEMKSGFVLTHKGTFSVPNVSGDLTSCSYPYTILPVVWESFTASAQENKSVNISWKVSQQIDDKGYYVERSSDGQNWDDIDFVANTGANGTDAQYAFTDNAPVYGTNYYRICQVDEDGKKSYSEIKTINISTVNTSINVWPNPAKDVIHIQDNNEGISIARIYSLSGSLISENKLSPGVSTISVSGLSYGVYILNVTTPDGHSYNNKIVKQ